MIHAVPNETESTPSQDRAKGDIEFQQVRLQYASAPAPVINELNLSVAAGEMIAIVGASGAGKTTLVNLLPRFMDASAGSILLDGHDLRSWTLRSLRAQFAFVSQHVIMLNDSIAANVALGMAIDRNRVAECLKSADLADLLNKPEGMDTVVGHNAMQLSGGQRQRLAIARALYKDAPILILDEATSALDTETERAIQEALQGLMRNRTTLVIAHRLSTVMHADRIVVMDAGRVMETGSHQQLLEKNGYYARLYQLGLESFIAKDADAPEAEADATEASGLRGCYQLVNGLLLQGLLRPQVLPGKALAVIPQAPGQHRVGQHAAQGLGQGTHITRIAQQQSRRFVH